MVLLLNKVFQLLYGIQIKNSKLFVYFFGNST